MSNSAFSDSASSPASATLGGAATVSNGAVFLPATAMSYVRLSAPTATTEATFAMWVFVPTTAPYQSLMWFQNSTSAVIPPPG